MEINQSTGRGIIFRRSLSGGSLRNLQTLLSIASAQLLRYNFRQISDTHYHLKTRRLFIIT